MKRILTLVAPAALAFAAFGAHASEVVPGDLGLASTKATVASPAAPVGRQPFIGELAPGDLGAQRLVRPNAAEASRRATPQMAVPLRADPVVGA